MKIGTKVKSNIEFIGVPEGTVGYIIDDYKTGLTVAWDLPYKPYPKYLSPQEVANMFAVNPKCPIRDGFDKKTELQFLDILEN